MPVMRVEDLRSMRDEWEKLALNRPFCSPDWMIPWSEHFRTARRPFVLAVYHNDQLIAIAPWHIHTSALGTARVGFLGTGKACSEYLGLLVEEGFEESTADQLSDWMVQAAMGEHGPENRWDRLDLEAISHDDQPIDLLSKKLSERGCQPTVQDGPVCWRLAVEETADQWLMRLNKSIRRKLRQLDQQAIKTGRATYRIAETNEEKRLVLERLVKLHNARRAQLGEVGCFATPGFKEFIQGVIFADWRSGAVRLSQLELDSRTIATGLCLETHDGLYVYQCGIEVSGDGKGDLAAANSGWLLNLYHIQYAYQRKLKFVDYLRGDEPYKHQLAAVPIRQQNIMLIPPVARAKVRQQVWTFGQAAKGLGKFIVNQVHQ
jgi:CelD/BcsL family acetyltransferase involved in cellulose biosynthesis